MKMILSKSLEELEGIVWPNSDIELPTTLVQRTFNLRKVPLKDLDVDDLRLLISQDIGLEFLIPLAINILSDDILAEGLYYPGDLLSSVLNIRRDFWQSHKNHKSGLTNVLKSQITRISDSDEINNSIKENLVKDIEAFRWEI